MATRSRPLELHAILADLDSISSNPSLLPASGAVAKPPTTTRLTDLSETSQDLTSQQAQDLAASFLTLSDEVLQKAGSEIVETVGNGFESVERKAGDFYEGLKAGRECA
jgi:hypothetical protein